ncbi:MAG: hypothetical protein ACHQF3_00045 [Alphaproteobacteria bacterium]
MAVRIVKGDGSLEPWFGSLEAPSRVVHLHSEGRHVSRHVVFVTPAADIPDLPGFRDSSNKPIMLAVEFESGSASVPEILGLYMIDRGIAHEASAEFTAGMTLMDALIEIAHPRERELAEQGAFDAARWQLAHMPELMRYLKRGEWHTTGISLPERALVLIEPFRWSELEPHCPESEAEGRAGHFISIRVYRSHKAAGQAVEIGRAGRRDLVCPSSSPSSDEHEAVVETRAEALASDIAQSEPIDHTGFAGRPTKSRHLIEAEFQRRWENGETHAPKGTESPAEWATALIEWLRAKYPDAAVPAPGTLQNNIRPLLSRPRTGRLERTK